MDSSSAAPTNTCWKVWQKHRREYCPFLEDRRDLSHGYEFLELLAEAGHSHVIKVRLQGNIYALKLYNLKHVYWTPRRFEQHALKYDPFMVECQVYDSLTEEKLLGRVGPYCFGWLTLDTEEERKLVKKFPKAAALRPTPDITAKEPIRGLLLEYIDGYRLEKALLTPAGAQSLRDQLNHLHTLDIAHGDFFPRNIMVSKDGRVLLIDFSAAIIWPHSNFLVRKREDFLEYIESEKSLLEYYLFRLQQLKRHEDVKLTEAKSEEDAYGQTPSDWIREQYGFVD
ncbi:hypothetical protein FQN50_004581 [Emmonsiellopsis sp. PD_5]|nr:hypothetical protein FQN50_004581 [Emmonsiellopsis sp. PD_5]